MTDLNPYEEGLSLDLAKALARIEELEDKLKWVLKERDGTFALMLKRAETAEAALATARWDALEDVLQSVGEMLAGTDEREASRHARAKIKRAIERAFIAQEEPTT